MQLQAPDDGRGGARNMLSDTKSRQVKTCETVASGWLICLNCMTMHGPANVKSPSVPTVC